MEHHAADTGAQFVLDNRKLIVGFALLVVLCGTFFVIGFMEGKRQGIQRAKERMQTSPAGETAAADLTPAATDKAVKAEPKTLPEKSVQEQLDWYKSVNKKEEAVKPAAAAPHKKQAEQRAAPARTTYTVQVGAFKLRKEAETKAAALKDAGYEYVIEAGGKGEPLFLLKVGNFESRADAVAMRLKLQKDGFSTFIKANP